ncbi:histidine kinase [Desulfonema ishimotonii]|uniref:Histidine kinase n=1 Tax=Desulfonema ishimotonii TaxID=45657 RepID=A0A401FUB2_9BACT|nr:response regulator [Desulfonema ishimotonii]GBC60551.1 histidine kinase [Desulfonema ishimotonii]
MSEKIRVLMVDDEEKFRETTSKILRKRGFDTTMAGTGEEAIEILEKQAFDVVVLDIKMPGMDGHDALSRIREIRAETQVIMLTGHGGVVSARASLEMGAYDYLNKPCDIDLLASKINDAYNAAHSGENREEKKVGDVMIRIEDYTTITGENTVKEAIEQLMSSFEGLVASNRIMETGHRSILVFDRDGRLSGILSIHDLIRAARPAYLSAPKPSMADSMQYSAMFWSGLFTTQVTQLAGKKVKEVMSASPPTVDADTNLMELADLMYSRNVRRVVVTRNGKVAGVVREQELFFEMAGIIL